MMMRKNYKHITQAMLLSCFAAVGVAHADMDILDGKVTVGGEINAGVQQRLLDGANGKFEEYRDVQSGFLVNDLRLKVDGNTTPYYLDIKIKNPVQDNESYQVKGGLHGKFGIGLTYDSTPHQFATGTLLFSGAGSGYLRIPDQIQKDLEANELLRVARGGNPLTAQAQDAAQRAIIRDLQANTNPMTFKLKREKLGATLDYNFTDDIKAWAKVSNEKKNGTRLISAGTYERYAQTVAGVHVSDLFLVNGVDMAEPIDYRTTTLNVGTGVYKKEWLADIQYSFTNFENENASLKWDNPFRFTDLSSSNAAGATNTNNGDFNRGRFATGQLSLAPNSQSHDITASASVDLPLHSKLTGTLSYGIVTQDDPFLPYTLNSAISGTNVAAFAGPANITDPATVAATSGHANLGGDVRTLSQSYVLSSKPIDSLAVTAKYRYYDYDNQSPAITFPGYAAFGESFWRTGNNDPRATANAGSITKPLSYTRQNAELAIDYHLFKPLTLMVEGGWEGWNRKNLRIDSTEELSVSGGFVYKPTKTANLSGRYKYSHRTVDGYKPGANAENPEAIGQANFDWAERIRHQANTRLMITPVESVTIGLSGQYQQDELGGNNRFGLKKTENAVGTIDIAYNPSEIFTVFANYVKEYRKGAMQSAAKDNAVGAENYFQQNFWNSDIYERTDTIGAGVTVQVIPSKLTLNTSYNLSYSKMDINTKNVALAANTLQNAIAQPFPTVTSRLQEVKADLAYNFTKNLKAGVTYLYEWYKLDDFANTSAYMAGTSVENSTKYVFAGANNYNYDAHVTAIYMNYKF